MMSKSEIEFSAEQAEKMGDLISRSKLLADLEEMEGYNCSVMYNRAYKDCVNKVRNQPAVDARPVVHGEWLSVYDYAIKIGVTDERRLRECKEDTWWKFCSICDQQVKGFHNLCPNCGADMRVTGNNVGGK